MATPSLASLRNAFPQAHLTLLIGSWSKNMVAGNPNVDEIIDCGALDNGGHLSLKTAAHLARVLRQRHFDCCFVLERSPVMTALPWLAGIPIRIGLDSFGRGFSLTVRVPCPDRRHEAELYLDVVRAAAVVPDHPHLQFFPSDEDIRKVNEALVRIDTAQGLVALHPGGGVNPGMSLVSKRWPAERFAAIADALIERGFRVLLVGGASDRRTADMVLASAKPGIIDLVGDINFGELGALFQRCRLVVANDTGSMHLAVAVGTPVVAIFGPSDPEVYGPYRQPEGVVTAGIGCSPCFMRGRSRDCTDHLCMNELPIEKVWSVIEARLNYKEKLSELQVVENLAGGNEKDQACR